MTRLHRRSAIFVFTLLVIGVSLACAMWVRNAQRQYALNRQLIAALEANDAEQAIQLVHAGADPNITYAPAPPPSLHDLWQFRPPFPAKIAGAGNTIKFSFPNPTALQMACGGRWLLLIDSNLFNPSGHFHPRKGEAQKLVEAMLQHGADPDLGPQDDTPLQIAQRQHATDLVALLRRYSKHP